MDIDTNNIFKYQNRMARVNLIECHFNPTLGGVTSDANNIN
jgi:hypothetical protein